MALALDFRDRCRRSLVLVRIFLASSETSVTGLPTLEVSGPKSSVIGFMLELEAVREISCKELGTKNMEQGTKNRTWHLDPRTWSPKTEAKHLESANWNQETAA